MRRDRACDHIFENGHQCKERCRRSTTYCARHASMVEGKSVRRPIALCFTKLVTRRLWSKTRVTWQSAQRRPACEHVSPKGQECKRRSRQEVGSKYYCKAHGRDAFSGVARSVLALSDFRDDKVPTHECNAMDDLCEHCSSLNFPEERVGRDLVITKV